MRNNLILIGMPGAGKSTVGVLLAKQLALDFIDTDLVLQRQTGLRLQQLINLQGLHRFRAAEEAMLISLDYTDTLIATGGSVIYSAPGMARLKELGRLVYLNISLPLLIQRIADTGERGILKPAGQSFADLYAERTPIYADYADVNIDIDGLSPEAVLQKIENCLKTG
ncbi:shikimate kinase [Geopsychrobacter electrodiphilus]|uniref:shikimate kinase n=1 Tax=Geopsychrobacter electrodiphilus TaxID=225196 RepID=UPI000377C1B4|nr:shikimate kinase [Geopsychrobacter electrodiphilus]